MLSDTAEIGRTTFVTRTLLSARKPWSFRPSEARTFGFASWRTVMASAVRRREPGVTPATAKAGSAWAWRATDVDVVIEINEVVCRHLGVDRRGRKHDENEDPVIADTQPSTPQSAPRS